jgi:uncharacterized protein
MNKKLIISITEKWVKEEMSSDTTGHDWWHIYRVRKLALKIAGKEKADLFIVEMASLLHDIADWKLANEEAAFKNIYSKLNDLSVPEASIKKVISIIKNISFKGAKVKTPMNTIEGKIVQDADRLDAMGAIGIARAFAYGGSKSRPMWDPASKPQLHKSFPSYKKSNSSSINHFYEKLLLLKDMMNTATGKKMAAERHLFMKKYLDEFFDEWEGKI